MAGAPDFITSGNNSARGQKTLYNEEWSHQMHLQADPGRRNVRSQLRNLDKKDLLGGKRTSLGSEAGSTGFGRANPNDKAYRCTSSLKTLTGLPGTNQHLMSQNSMIKKWPQVKLKPSKIALKRLM